MFGIDIMNDLHFNHLFIIEYGILSNYVAEVNIFVISIARLNDDLFILSVKADFR